MKKYFLILFLISLHVIAAEVQEYYFNVDARGEKIPIKIYLKAESKNNPLIVYSHGLGGSRETKKYLLEFWAEAGFICVSVQHPGSDEQVWKNTPLAKRFKAMKDAASSQQFLNRTVDIPKVMNQLEIWNKDKNHQLFAKIDFSKAAMSGHSFGAVTTQAMMGAAYPGRLSFTEKRFKAFLLMSPSPVLGNDKAFSEINKPVLCMTGTKDTSMIKPGTGYKERATVFENLPVGNKYLYVFDKGRHNLFSGPTKLNRQLKNEHKRIQQLTLLFWQAHLLNDAKAKNALTLFKTSNKDVWKLK